MDGSKESIRQEMRRRRRALSDADLTAADRAVAAVGANLEAFRTATAVLAYVATDGEVPTRSLIEAARAAGKRVYLPRCQGTTMHFAEQEAGTTLRPGPLGIPEPTGRALDPAAQAAAIAFVPLLAWDEDGSRLGRGGGHYDRAFAGSSRPRCLIGLGYTFQQHAALPRDPWDLRLDWVVTERGAVRCGGGDDPSPARKEDTPHHGIRDDGGARGRAGGRAGLGRRLPPATAS